MNFFLGLVMLLVRGGDVRIACSGDGHRGCPTAIRSVRESAAAARLRRETRRPTPVQSKGPMR
jgi:hypothetical protein